MNGNVTPDRQAAVQLIVLSPDGTTQSVRAIVDTGFTDYLTLPLAVITSLGLQSLGTVDAILANGEEVSLASYRSSVLLNEEIRFALVLEAEGIPLIGMSLLYGSRLTIDIVDGGEVSIVPIA